jgi:hypothetical protein
MRVRRICSAVATTGALTLLFAASLIPAASAASTVKYLGTMHVTAGKGDPGNYDIGWVDQSTGRYFLSDATNNAIDIFNAKTDTFMGFTGAGRGVPNGVLADNQHRVWTGDVDHTVRVLQPTPGGSVVKDGAIPIPHTTGLADELSFDPVNHVVLIASPSPQDRYVTWIDTKTLKVLGQYRFPKKGFNGIEQSLWDRHASRFFISVPGSSNNSVAGKIDVFSPTSPGSAPTTLAKLTTCGNGNGGPRGLTLGPGADLFAVCDTGVAVVDVATGHLEKLVKQLPVGDEIWFNKGDGNAYTGLSAGSPVGKGLPGLGALDASTNTPIGRQPLLAPLDTAKRPGPPLDSTVAAYAANNHIFMPEGCGFGFPCNKGAGGPGYGIAVFSTQ